MDRVISIAADNGSRAGSSSGSQGAARSVRAFAIGLAAVGFDVLAAAVALAHGSGSWGWWWSWCTLGGFAVGVAIGKRKGAGGEDGSKSEDFGEVHDDCLDGGIEIFGRSCKFGMLECSEELGSILSY